MLRSRDIRETAGNRPRSPRSQQPARVVGYTLAQRCSQRTRQSVPQVGLSWSDLVLVHHDDGVGRSCHKRHSSCMCLHMRPRRRRRRRCRCYAPADRHASSSGLWWTHYYRPLWPDNGPAWRVLGCWAALYTPATQARATRGVGARQALRGLVVAEAPSFTGHSDQYFGQPMASKPAMVARIFIASSFQLVFWRTIEQPPSLSVLQQ